MEIGFGLTKILVSKSVYFHFYYYYYIIYGKNSSSGLEMKRDDQKKEIKIEEGSCLENLQTSVALLIILPNITSEKIFQLVSSHTGISFLHLFHLYAHSRYCIFCRLQRP